MRFLLWQIVTRVSWWLLCRLKGFIQWYQWTHWVEHDVARVLKQPIRRKSRNWRKLLEVEFAYVIQPNFDNISFSLRKGEILGVWLVSVGSGRNVKWCKPYFWHFNVMWRVRKRWRRVKEVIIPLAKDAIVDTVSSMYRKNGKKTGFVLELPILPKIYQFAADGARLVKRGQVRSRRWNWALARQLLLNVASEESSSWKRKGNEPYRVVISKKFCYRQMVGHQSKSHHSREPTKGHRHWFLKAAVHWIYVRTESILGYRWLWCRLGIAGNVLGMSDVFSVWMKA